MKPIFRPKEYESFVLYPYHIFHIKLYYKRLRSEAKIFHYYAYIDLRRMGIERGDSFIETEEWDVDEKMVMKPVVTDYEELKNFALKKAVEWSALRVVSWWHPLVEIVDDKKAYKIFWIYQKDGKRFLMDSFNGHEFPIEDIINKIKKKKLGY